MNDGNLPTAPWLSAKGEAELQLISHVRIYVLRARILFFGNEKLGCKRGEREAS